jgi:hypothetical protein
MNFTFLLTHMSVDDLKVTSFVRKVIDAMKAAES